MLLSSLAAKSHAFTNYVWRTCMQSSFSHLFRSLNATYLTSCLFIYLHGLTLSFAFLSPFNQFQ